MNEFVQGVTVVQTEATRQATFTVQLYANGFYARFEIPESKFKEVSTFLAQKINEIAP